MEIIGITLVFILFTNICERTYGDDEDEKEVGSPEEELYGVKFARECEEGSKITCRLHKEDDSFVAILNPIQDFLAAEMIGVSLVGSAPTFMVDGKILCKYLVIELENRLFETGKTHDVIETGYELDSASRKKTKYAVSELRLLESLEGICDRLLDYNIHKERKDSTRFAKGMSTTFKVLHDLVDKGVKVELGIPEDLWDKPSAEVTHLKMQCENLLEKHEADIEDWYFNHQDIPLKNFLCIDKALHKGDTGCLDENYVPSIDNTKSKGEKQDKKKVKNSTKKKKNSNQNQKDDLKDEL